VNIAVENRLAGATARGQGNVRGGTLPESRRTGDSSQPAQSGKYARALVGAQRVYQDLGLKFQRVRMMPVPPEKTAWFKGPRTRRPSPVKSPQTAAHTRTKSPLSIVRLTP